MIFECIMHRFFAGLIALFFLQMICTAQSIALTNSGASYYKIVVANSNAKSYASAQRLSDFIKQISGASIPVAGDNIQPEEKEIIVGNTKHINALHLNINVSEIEDNRYIIKTFGNTILLYGKSDYDAANCVYWFLEKYLGCSMLSSDVTVVPHMKSITLSSINDDYKPSFTYRDLYYKDAYDSIYTKFNRINHFDAGGQNRLWGEIWSSSFNAVIPPKKYFSIHPEYFSLNSSGQRVPDQLDLTNDDMLKVYVENFRKLMARFPASKIWSVAANDAEVPNYCHCSKCMAINNKEGTPMGALLYFVNKIAAQFPDKIIATQAYRFYEEPPKTIKPASNVLIVECGAFLLNQAISYQNATDAAAATYRRRLKQWLAITKNVRIWDYVIDFPHLMCPHPNFQVLQKNLQWYAQLGIKDVFMQGNISTGGEFAELRAWLLAQLLWNSNLNYDNAVNYFLNNYYGKAGTYIQKYISLTTSSLLQSKIPLGAQDHPHKHYKGFLAPAQLIAYNKIFDDAEAAVSNNAEQLERVRVARLPLIYAMLEISKMVNIANKKQNVNAAVGYSNNKKITDLLGYFVDMCKKHGIERMAESSTKVDAYQQDFKNFVSKNY